MNNKIISIQNTVTLMTLVGIPRYIAEMGPTTQKYNGANIAGAGHKTKNFLFGKKVIFTQTEYRRFLLQK